MATAAGTKQEAPFGAWKSPLTTELVTSGSLRLGQAQISDDGKLVWKEGRPSEAGRSVLVMRDGLSDGPQKDLTPADHNVRTLVHEYGGESWGLFADCVIYSNMKDQRLYMQKLTGDQTPVALTPEVEGMKVRYGDGVLDTQRQRFITIREDHREEGKECKNEIVAVDLTNPTAEPVVLVTGHDFVSYPRLSPDGRQLAFTTWEHPNMPWDATQLWLADVTDAGELSNVRSIAGGKDGAVEAATQPSWSPAGELFYVTDKGTGFWNIHRWDGSSSEAITSLEAEFALPQWLLGIQTFTFVPETAGKGTHILAAYRDKGIGKLAVIDASSKALYPVETAYSDISYVGSGGGKLLTVAASATEAPSVLSVELSPDLKGGVAQSVLFCSSSLDTGKYRPYLTVPESISFPTKDGETAYAIYYPPANADFQGTPGEKPPLLVKSHGGPTSEVGTSLKLGIQYWTSRGWAVADVNYRGSTGYGREYREKLYGTWGIVDIDDCCSAADYLVKAGKVDGQRLAIDGGSAGGYTTLAVLAFRDTFKAGCSYYGVSDLMTLAQETHKFESRYLDKLVGPVATAAQLYDERSPIKHVDGFSCPVILFQGLEDKVVPPNQARMMYEAVKAKGIPTALVEYEGEQHGFRKAENIKTTLEWELFFYSKVFNFTPADPIAPLHIDNL
ncbi:Prolyl Oligopeptidase [Klebsormidium nitens]|uniref:Prolyl Oligopeptidase n=1 Tax=Klebsormidium nitens TaxID=105231 RepID=A0A1Y1HPK9_KLENI|nr:Prolyl Oligopeptidase [Klebsormidium nitens]|eukprot:GAQ78911.1 Prolyl Oligopeptidase [Klebsormidium nitens]